MKKVLFASAIGAALVVTALAATMNSGLKKGESISAFHPYHVSGPLAESTKCFPCTFQNRPQVQVWVNGDDIKNVAAIAKQLQAATEANKGKEFKAMVVFLASPSKVDATKAAVKDASKMVKANDVAMSVLSTDDDAVKAYRINLEAKNTVFVYKNWKVADTMVNLKGDAKGLGALNTAINGVL
jgi:protein-disulfide isomerase